MSPEPETVKPRRVRIAAALLIRDVEARQALDLRIGEIDDLRLVTLVADDLGLGGLAAAKLQHQFRRALKAGDHIFRIDAAFEAVAGIGDDAEAAAGFGDVHRIPEGGFDQHVDGVLVAAGMFAAHDAADRFDAVFIGDDDVVSATVCIRADRAPAPSRLQWRGGRSRLPLTLAASKTCIGRP